MKQSLPRELEKHLKKKCWGLLSYYQPEWGTVSIHSLACSYKFSLISSTFISRHCSAPTWQQRMLFCFFVFFREWEWWSEEHKVVSSISPAGQREEKSRESEGDLPGKHSSSAKTDSTLPLCKSSVNQHVADQNKLIIQCIWLWANCAFFAGSLTGNCVPKNI